MKIELKSLQYSLRGQSRSLEFSDKTLISGRNGSGKSTVLNALLWLTTNCDNEDNLNANLFDNRTPNIPEVPKSVFVKGTFDANGIELKLEKRAKQVWKREKGKSEYKRGNDVYQYFVNDLEVSAGEYAEMVESTFGKGEKLKLMLNSDYWQMLDEKVLRRHFLTLVGDINDKEFINEDYTLLYPELHKTMPDGKPYDVAPEDVRQTFMKRINELKKQHDELDASIDYQSKNLTDISQVPEWEKKIEELKAERESIDAKLLGLADANKAYVETRQKEESAILEAENAYHRLKLKYENEQRDRLRDAQRKLDEALANNRSLDGEEARLKRMIEDCESVIRTKELEIDEKLKEVERIDLRRFDGDCPYCGNALVGAKRADAIARFKEKQSTDKSLTIEQGKRLRVQLNDAKERLPKLQEELASLKRIDTKPLREALAKVQDESQRPFETTQESKDMLAEIEMMKANRTEMQPNPDIEQGQIRKGEIDSELTELIKATGAKEKRAEEEGKLEMLKAQLRQNVDAKCENEKMKALCEAYIKEQSEVIRVRANRLFDRVIVEMEQENKSGQIVPCCKLRVDGVVDTANTASRTRIGFEVSRAFQRYYDRVLPLFLDRAESLNEENVPVPDGQLVLLKVTDGEFKVEEI